MTKILLVEDDLFLVKIYKLKLEAAGFEVRYLSDGLDVLKVAQEFRPNLILLDIVMPKKDGFAVLQELDYSPDLKTIPVMVLSALQTHDDIAKGKALGADEYLTKTTVTIDEVITKISALSSSN